MMQVDVGDFLRFKSCVLYTEAENSDRPLIHVEVVAHVTRPELRSSAVCMLRFQPNVAANNICRKSN